MEQVNEIRELTTDETDMVSGGTAALNEKVLKIAQACNEVLSGILGGITNTKSETTKDLAGAMRG